MKLDNLTCEVDDVAGIVRRLRRYGLVRIPDAVTDDELNCLRAEAREAVESHANYLNPYGPCARFTLYDLPPSLSRSRDLTNGSHLQALPVSFGCARRFLERQMLRQVIAEYLGPASGFMEVVAFTRDCTPDPEAVYGKLHFDRRHQLKAILYLNDADERNGAFGGVPGSHRIGERLYRHGWRKVLGLQSTDPADIDAAAARVPEDDPVYRSMPCILGDTPAVSLPTREHKVVASGAAGTLVLFDTHLFHFGGFVKDVGQERWTLKGHTFAEAAAVPGAMRVA